MKKLFLIIVCIASCALFSTSCTKNCSCQVEEYYEITDPSQLDEEFISMLNSMRATATVQQTINKGKCSDINEYAEAVMPGYKQIVKSTCK